jgi:hypothetical protein
VLHVSASFRNDARWEQPWPTVLLTLSDMDGRQVGLRAFSPADYLGKARRRVTLRRARARPSSSTSSSRPAGRGVHFDFM